MDPNATAGVERAAPAPYPRSAVVLLAGVVDYAGLFPPAALPMSAAMAGYLAARSGPDAWMLGRFVLPAGRLAEFADARATFRDSAAWRLSAIVGDGVEADAVSVRDFNAAAGRYHARVDAIEARPESVQGINWLADSFGRDIDRYVEIASGSDAVRGLERIAARGLRAKVRTGGVTPDAFPAPAALLAFIEPAVRLRVPFKATAGLHHAVGGTHRLTYEAEAPQGPMYGYLNVLLATAALRAGLPASAAADLLRRTDTSSLVFAGDAVRWGEVELPVGVLQQTRAGQFVSFGSCSFREPVDEFQTLSSC
jgi:hypothetical protein